MQLLGNLVTEAATGVAAGKGARQHVAAAVAAALHMGTELFCGCHAGVTEYRVCGRAGAAVACHGACLGCRAQWGQRWGVLGGGQTWEKDVRLRMGRIEPMLRNCVQNNRLTGAKRVRRNVACHHDLRGGPAAIGRALRRPQAAQHAGRRCRGKAAPVEGSTRAREAEDTASKVALARRALDSDAEAMPEDSNSEEHMSSGYSVSQQAQSDHGGASSEGGQKCQALEKAQTTWSGGSSAGTTSTSSTTSAAGRPGG